MTRSPDDPILIGGLRRGCPRPHSHVRLRWVRLRGLSSKNASLRVMAPVVILALLVPKVCFLA